MPWLERWAFRCDNGMVKYVSSKSESRSGFGTFSILRQKTLRSPEWLRMANKVAN